jgi:superfamily II DNA or RNA helicase
MVPKDPFQRAADSSFPAYTLSENILQVPRWYGVRAFGPAKQDATQVGKDLTDEATRFHGRVQEHQVRPIEAAMDTFESSESPSPRGGMICLGCGQGKTVCALNIISKLKRRTLVLCHKTFLIDQWHERAASFLPGARVGIIRQRKAELDADIVIASLQSVALRNYEANTFDGFGLLVIDEAHHLSAPCLSRALQKLPMRYVLALSATPERRDGLTSLLYDSMGPILYRSERPQEHVMVSRLIYKNRSKQIELLGKDNKPLFARMLNKLADDSERTAIVAQHLHRHLQNGRQIIVLSDRIHLLEALSAAVVALGTNADDVALYIGRCTAAERETASAKQLIMSTYSLAREGLDLARLDTLCLLTPSSSVEQATGRILRPNANKKVPLVIDVVDPFSLFAHMSRKRLRYYRSRSYVIQDGVVADWVVGDARWFD